MSEIYVSEPPTKGKVIMHTSHGPLDVELWSKECPKTCERFFKRCYEKVYNDVLFQRIVPNFIIETEEIEKDCFKMEETPVVSEFHPRLKFRYRGLIGMVPKDLDLGKVKIQARDPDYTKTSQFSNHFFITLGPANILNQKSILFGKVTGNSLYNLLNLADVSIDRKTGKPLSPIKINYIEILYCPFEKIILNYQTQTDKSKELLYSACKSELSDIKAKSSLTLEYEDFDVPNPQSNQKESILSQNVTLVKEMSSEKANHVSNFKQKLKMRVADHLKHECNNDNTNSISEVVEEVQHSELNLRKHEANMLASTISNEDQVIEKPLHKRDVVKEKKAAEAMKNFVKKLRSKNENEDAMESDPFWFNNKLNFGVDSSRAYEWNHES